MEKFKYKITEHQAIELFDFLNKSMLWKPKTIQETIIYSLIRDIRTTLLSKKIGQITLSLKGEAALSLYYYYQFIFQREHGFRLNLLMKITMDGIRDAIHKQFLHIPGISRKEPSGLSIPCYKLRK